LILEKETETIVEKSKTKEYFHIIEEQEHDTSSMAVRFK